MVRVRTPRKKRRKSAGSRTRSQRDPIKTAIHKKKENAVPRRLKRVPRRGRGASRKTTKKKTSAAKGLKKSVKKTNKGAKKATKKTAKGKGRRR